MRVELVLMTGLAVLASCAGPAAEEWRPAPLGDTIPLEPSPPGWDAEHYELELRPVEGAWQGRLRLRLAVLEQGAELRLDCAGLRVDSVRDELGRPLDYRLLPGQLAIQPPAQVQQASSTTVEIGYGMLQVTGGSKLQPLSVWDGCYFPSLAADSDLATSDLYLRLPVEWEWSAAGSLLERHEGEGQQGLHLRRAQPHLPRSIVISAGPPDLGVISAGPPDLGVIPAGPPDLGVIPAGPPDLGPDLDADLAAEAAQVLAFLAAWTQGPAPWPGLDPTQAAKGDLVLALPEALGTDERSRRDALGAPLVRAWARRWLSDLLHIPLLADGSGPWWLEGLARQAELDWMDDQGLGGASEELRMSWIAGLGKGVPGVLSGTAPLGEARGGQAGLVLELLRAEIGSPAYRSGLARFLGRGRGSLAGEIQLRESMQLAAGSDLDSFFAQWIEAPGYPQLETSWSYDRERGRVLLRVNQGHSLEHGEPEAYAFRVQVHVEGAKGALVHEVLIDERRNLIEFAQDTEPLWIRFDIGRRIPASLRERRSEETWFRMLRAEADIGGRLASVEALLAFASSLEQVERVAEQFALRLAQDPSPAVRAGLAVGLGQLATMHGVGEGEVLRRAAQEDPAAAVRVAALRALVALAKDDPQSNWSVVRGLVKEAYSWSVLSAALELGSQIDRPGTLELVSEGLPSGSLGEERALGLQVLVWTRAPRALEACLEVARDPRAGILARKASVYGLEALLRRDGRSQAREGLAELLHDPSTTVAYPAAEALARAARSGDRGARRILEESYSGFSDPRMRQVIQVAWAE